jgi:class 3 adenylate cyclase
VASSSAVRYARSGDLSIAYRVLGEGDRDVVFVSGFVSHLDLSLELAPLRLLIEGLGRFARVVLFDTRGTGLSERALGVGTLEERMDDVRAVMNATDLESADMVGISAGGPMALLFAASHPERVRSLALYGSLARVARAPDYPMGADIALLDAYIDELEQTWGTGKTLLRGIFADTPPDEEALEALARFERSSSTPQAAASIMRCNVEIDVRHVLSAITAPTLISHCTGDPFIHVGHGRFLADHIPGATYREVDDDFHLTWRADRLRPVLEAIEEFLTGQAHFEEPDRVLKTVLFTDIVDSTATAARMGDGDWHRLLDAHDRVVRRELARFRGVEVKTTGDGFLAAFDGPARGVRCAQEIIERARSAGLHVRAGLHTGECELRGEDIAGLAVHIGARVAAHAAPGEVLVSSTVRDLVAGSGLDFDDRGEHELKGVPGRWKLLAAT